jgi:hypothetical protein
MFIESLSKKILADQYKEREKAVVLEKKIILEEITLLRIIPH